MRKKNLMMLFACVLLLTLSCAGLVNGQELLIGEGSFVYRDYKPLADKPITIRYYVPKGKPDTEVLILMHGNSRNAEGYWKSMLKFAKEYQFLLIVPEFSKEYFPRIRDYHHGGIISKEGGVLDRKYWTFSLIEPLFDYIKEQTGNTSTHYNLYGFSAGSQFVHRFMMFQQQNRAYRVIAASAGTYTMPDPSIRYSYGLSKTPIDPSDLSVMLQKDVTILVGEADTVLSRPDLAKSTLANKQGRDRVERGKEFYRQSKKLAEQLKVPFGWKYVLTPDVGHSQADIAPIVAKILFGNNQNNRKKSNDKKRL